MKSTTTIILQSTTQQPRKFSYPVASLTLCQFTKPSINHGRPQINHQFISNHHHQCKPFLQFIAATPQYNSPNQSLCQFQFTIIISSRHHHHHRANPSSSVLTVLIDAAKPRARAHRCKLMRPCSTLTRRFDVAHSRCRRCQPLPHLTATAVVSSFPLPLQAHEPVLN
ncbi:hypothetical protein M0R45_006974 [Rubus argutus]|uniref:Uncharacterized protein n=1 Tax=Rubus argutus TaxID=59490 RepID=A0AAW1YSS7_RUBAR